MASSVSSTRAVHCRWVAADPLVSRAEPGVGIVRGRPHVNMTVIIRGEKFNGQALGGHTGDPQSAIDKRS